MATSHGFDSVAQIMARLIHALRDCCEDIHVQLLNNDPTRHPHPGMKSVLASLFPDHPLVTESSSTEDHLMDEDQVWYLLLRRLYSQALSPSQVDLTHPVGRGPNIRGDICSPSHRAKPCGGPETGGSKVVR